MSMRLREPTSEDFAPEVLNNNAIKEFKDLKLNWGKKSYEATVVFLSRSLSDLDGIWGGGIFLNISP